jgi:exopolyphosphatase/guanosine-5'-triphosphate,3'-diphosphate pyrophosphatase
VLLGFPGADGVLGDLGGGSLEVVRLAEGRVARAASLPIGAIRLAERPAARWPAPAPSPRRDGEAFLACRGRRRDLYLVGGAWRALARMHIAQTGYPLAIVHHYVLRARRRCDLAGVVMAASRRVLERMAARAAEAPGRHALRPR